MAALASLRDENPSTRRGTAATGAEVRRGGAGHVGERSDGGKVFSASRRSAYVVRVRACSELGSTLQNFMEQTCTLHPNTSCVLMRDSGFLRFVRRGAVKFFFS